MLKYEREIREWLVSHRDELLSALLRFVSVPSVVNYGGDGYPYGKPCHDMMDLYQSEASAMGFQTERFGEHIIRVTDGAAKPGKTIGVWAHLDVVPAGDNWHSDPYQPFIRDGFAVGRGTDDNKSAAAGGLFILRCLRELGIQLKGNVQLFAGCDEECGSRGVKWYAENHTCPDLSMIPDCGFPVCYGEKGIIKARILAPDAVSGDIVSLCGGSVNNVIPAVSSMTLKADERVLNGLSALPECIEAAVDNGTVVLTAHGKAGHAAGPQNAVNANLLLLDAVLKTHLLSEEDEKRIAFLRDVANDYTGAVIGIDSRDEVSGATTCAGTILSLKDGKPCLELNIRYCISEKGGRLLAAMENSCAAAGFTLADTSDSAPNYFPREAPVVDALCAVFRAVTGSDRGPFVMSGGTYARELPNAFAYGIGAMPFEKPAWLGEACGGAHQADEVLCIDTYLEALTIFTLGLIEADRCLNEID